MKYGLIISSTGSPSSTNIEDIKNFLKNFLGDKKLIKIPPPVLFLIIKFRSKIVKKKYEKILIKGKTPMNFYMQELKENLQKRIPDLKIEIGNLYAPPYLEERIKKLYDSNIKRIYLLPLYPHKSPATTEILKYYFNKIIKDLDLEGLIFPEYYRHPLYKNAIAKKINEKKENFDFLIFSYHSLPENMEGAQDYKKQCMETTDLILEETGFKKELAKSGFQSKFGFQKWLKPSTFKILKEISGKNLKKVGIISPSFPLDCLETLYDINIYFKDYYRKLTGKDLIYIEALNSSREHIDFLKKFIEDNI